VKEMIKKFFVRSFCWRRRTGEVCPVITPGLPLRQPITFTHKSNSLSFNSPLNTAMQTPLEMDQAFSSYQLNKLDQKTSAIFCILKRF